MSAIDSSTHHTARCLVDNALNFWAKGRHEPHGLPRTVEVRKRMDDTAMRARVAGRGWGAIAVSWMGEQSARGDTSAYDVRHLRREVGVHSGGAREAHEAAGGGIASEGL